jgi:hypothetical protein
MKVELLRLNKVNKPSPIFEGVTDIQINSQSCKGIILKTWHMEASWAPRVATVHDAVKEMIRAHLTLVHGFYVYALADTPCVAHALFWCTPIRYGSIDSISATHDATQFGDSICPVCISTFKCLLNRAQPTRALIDTGEGYHLGALNFRSDHSSSFPSSIHHFPLIALPDHILNHSINYPSSQHSFLEPGYKKS